ncbi:FKBP-type peptidyl-prolyl cis-trans isomerase [Actinoplanes sp. TBRC 11911]|uniref:FKBP-type peptidyl-prolyl cis-trans isomerase n=1 Tax=Actinoplanes sp. TBRC 11911 TaxID=2729386 RepID=UPI00145E628F|nr:FKBP-type peptidyl-prolyl cis-trans isomerase [Actinoplanes sp. TBRC 11911]NMO56598.1 FKBP-type peptidyl-prolyl cis-trans isomerase [Actinoplanes sp. TBRC 11911]
MSTPTTADAKRRGQAFAGGIAGVAVIVALVVVFLVIKAGDDGKPDTGAVAQAAPTQPASPQPASPPAEQADPAQADPAQPAQPAQVDIPPALAQPPVVKAGTGTLSALKVTTLIPGDGPAVKSGQTITVNYALVDYKTGQPLESSFDSGQPFSTPIGVGKVIPGWDQGVPGQKVGSRIQLDVPADLAYGPSQGDLRFVVDILAAQ